MISQQLRFFITCPNEPEQPFYPVNEKISFSWKLDEKLKAWRYEMDQSICIKNTLQKDGYPTTQMTFDKLYELERQCLICPIVLIRVECWCDGLWQEEFKGYLPFRKGKWDKDICQYDIQPRPDDQFRCLTDEKKNLLEIEQTATVTTIIGDVICENLSFAAGSTLAPPSGYGWTITKTIETSINGELVGTEVTFCRECYSSVPVDPENWQLENAVYYRPLSVVVQSVTSQQENNSANGENIELLILTTCYEVVDFQADNALTLGSVFQFLALECGFPICSDFFGINPIGDAPNNNEYQCAAKELHNIVLFQASDIIRANADNNATKFEKSFCEVWQSFSDRYQLQMFFDDVNNCIRLEHDTYTINGKALDLTSTQKLLNCVIGNRKYSYNDDDFPLRQGYKDKIETNKPAFNNASFEYPIECSTDDLNLQDDDTEDECAITDLGTIYNNEEYADSDDVLLSMVPVALDSAGNVISGIDPITGEGCLNSPLSWASAISKYHQHNRPLPYGKMNGENASFYGTKPTRESPELSFCLPCEYWKKFKPWLPVITPDGKAFVKSVSYERPSQLVTITVCYPCSST